MLGNMECWQLDEADRKGGAFVALETEFAFLRRTPLYCREEEVLFVHTGIRPGVPLIRQPAADLTGIRSEFLG